MNNTLETLSASEQRIDERLDAVCPVYIHGMNEDKEQIKIETVTDNISEGGLYLQAPCSLSVGCYLFTFVRLLSGARLAARGKVVRVKKEKYGLSGIAVCFNQTRLISA